MTTAHYFQPPAGGSAAVLRPIQTKSGFAAITAGLCGSVGELAHL